MPKTKVLFYQDDKKKAPVVEWLMELKRVNRRAYAKCVVRIMALADSGRELRRPVADLLEGGIHELRARLGRVNYRILYFFHGENVVVLAHALTKEAAVRNADIKRALKRKEAFEADPAAHTFIEEMPNA